MSSFGSISAMLISLKNNKIPKRERKLGNKEYPEGVTIGPPLRFKNKMSVHQLETLRQKLWHKKRKTTRRTILIYAITLVSVSLIVTYKIYTF